MKRVVIELDPAVHKAFREMCFIRNTTMKDKLTGLILKAIESNDKK